MYKKIDSKWFCIVAVLGVVLCLNACTKCYTCQNTCYKCGSLQLCNTESLSQQQFDTVITHFNQQGMNCNIVEPSISFKVCDDNKSAENFKWLFKDAMFSCN